MAVFKKNAEKLLESHYKELEKRGNEEYHQMSLILQKVEFNF